jgi:hypothetical protein
MPRAVQIIKNLVSGAKDPYAALLEYRMNPLANGYSPSELLMTRKLHTKLPDWQEGAVLPTLQAVLR